MNKRDNHALQATPVSWPLDGIDSSGRLSWSMGHESIRESIWNILLTRPGERLMRPEFGAGIRNFIHHPNNETTRHLLADVIDKAVGRWETRIEMQAIEVQPDTQNLAQVNITLRYRLKSGNQQDSISMNMMLGN